MKKLLSVLVLSLLLTSCFGETEVELDPSTVDVEGIEEVTNELLEGELLEEIPGETTEASEEEAPEPVIEEVQIRETGAADPEYDVRSNIESDPEAVVTVPKTEVIPTAPIVEEVVVESATPSEADSDIGDEVVDEFEDELNELFDLLESDA